MAMSTPPRFNEVVSRTHLPALDGLRAVAVFIVIFGHTGYPVAGVPSDLGVSAFFVLSGFLITRLLMREHTASGTVSLKRFYARRTLRIFPAYYAFLLFTYLIDRALGDIWSPALGLSAVTYTVNYFNALHGHPSTSIAHAWSLAIEEQFYLLWPLVFLLLARYGRRALVTGVAVMAAIAIVWRTTLMLGADPSISYVYNAFETRFDNLAIGCAFAIVADHKRFAIAAERLAHRAWYPLLTIAALIASRIDVSNRYHYTAGLTVDAVLVAILIVQLLQLSVTRPWSWIDHRAVRFLGTISYPMYLYHALGAAVGRRAPWGGVHAEFALSVAATIGIATALHFAIEKPFLRLKTRFGPPRGPDSTAAGVAATVA